MEKMSTIKNFGNGFGIGIDYFYPTPSRFLKP
jgi:hypothetical protein